MPFAYFTMKKEIYFICKNCQQTFPRWYGRCPSCDSWNSIEEEVNFTNKTKNISAIKKIKHSPIPINEIHLEDIKPISTKIHELDRVLGNGFIPGETILLGGEPGIGKSTLALQISQNLALDEKVLYISGEESIQQIYLRAKRLGAVSENLLVYSEVNILEIIEVIKHIQPKLVVLDSIQVVYHPDLPSTIGSVNQVRECANHLIHCLKDLNIIGIIIGHITKDGNLAGPKILEHLVDAILYFEGERSQKFRILRCFKNRFSSTDEIGVFEIKAEGLKEVANANDLFIDEATLNSPGSMVSAVMEGSRSFLIEVQALAVNSGYGIAKRTFSGVDLNRANLMIATLEKKLNFKLFNKDIFLNIIGGLKINEPALDLAIILAIISSLTEKPLGGKIGAIGEVGLTGEVRTVNNIEKRLNELEKMGFTECLIPAQNKNQNLTQKNITPIYIKNIKEAINYFVSKSKK